ncbi:hypothetical protein M9978_16430 [Sphingomonas sp. MG17]|uniref:Uncharacterized protein n=1 Tax=Sphingomonas tagetis TaxID=2949092 RepID=A0A9X2KQQ2_9SPHN|nr:hypothetical protein [Sphingomonas tagetis]MCP3732013.1 hypothetical protein [Sphingomonas tagetis]
MLAHERAALEGIRALYGRPVAYTGAGLTDETIIAIRSDTRAVPHEGFAGRPNGLSFEIFRDDFPQEPRKGNLIVEEDGSRWSVIDRNEADDIDSWILSVEEAPAP